MDFWGDHQPAEDDGDTDFRISLQFQQLAAIQKHRQGK